MELEVRGTLQIKPKETEEEIITRFQRIFEKGGVGKATLKQGWSLIDSEVEDSYYPKYAIRIVYGKEEEGG